MGTKKPETYQPAMWMWHVGADNLTPTFLRSSAVTNRVIGYNAKRGIAKDLDYDKARKLLSALANSGSSHGSPEDALYAEDERRVKRAAATGSFALQSENDGY